MISCIRRKAAKLHLGGRQSAKVGKPAYAAAFIFARDSLQGRGQYGLVKGEREKGKGFKYIRPLAQECFLHSCGQRDTSLLGKGKIPNMHPLSPAPYPLQGPPSPFPDFS